MPFRLTNPRKGTETQHIYQQVTEVLSPFRLTNPRKGTETSLVEFRRPHLSPFRLTNPRKGTETLEYDAILLDVDKLSV